MALLAGGFFLLGDTISGQEGLLTQSLWLAGGFAVRGHLYAMPRADDWLFLLISVVLISLLRHDINLNAAYLDATITRYETWRYTRTTNSSYATRLVWGEVARNSLVTKKSHSWAITHAKWREDDESRHRRGINARALYPLALARFGSRLDLEYGAAAALSTVFRCMDIGRIALMLHCRAHVRRADLTYGASLNLLA